MMKYLDTNILVYAIEQHPEYGRSCTHILRMIQNKKLTVGASTLVLLETVGVLRKLNGILKRKKHRPLDIHENISAILSLPIVWFDLNPVIIKRATRYDDSIQTNDLIHVVTAELNEMKEIISADTDFDRVDFLKRIDPKTFARLKKNR